MFSTLADKFVTKRYGFPSPEAKSLIGPVTITDSSVVGSVSVADHGVITFNLHSGNSYSYVVDDEDILTEYVEDLISGASPGEIFNEIRSEFSRIQDAAEPVEIRGTLVVQVEIEGDQDLVNIALESLRASGATIRPI